MIVETICAQLALLLGRELPELSRETTFLEDLGLGQAEYDRLLEALAQAFGIDKKAMEGTKTLGELTKAIADCL